MHPKVKANWSVLEKHWHSAYTCTVCCTTFVECLASIALVENVEKELTINCWPFFHLIELVTWFNKVTANLTHFKKDVYNLEKLEIRWRIELVGVLIISKAVFLFSPNPCDYFRIVSRVTNHFFLTYNSIHCGGTSSTVRREIIMLRQSYKHSQW